MERERLRVLVLGLASVGMLVAAGFVLDWFSVFVGGFGELAPSTSVGISLSSMHGCAGDGCTSLSLSRFGGVFPSLCHATLVVTGMLAAIVALQVGARMMIGEARAWITRVGYWVAMFDILLIVLTAYIFDPALPAGASQGAEAFGMSFEVTRSYAPALAFAGTLTSFFALYATVRPEREATLPPLGVIVRTTTLARPPTAPPVVPDEPTAKPHPAVNYAVASAELSRAGIDARREDGAARLVLWRDVVGIVVRRLPEELGGAPFADLISIADATLRVVPWSRLAGDPIATSDDPDVRARAIVAYVREHVPAIKLDPLTRAFVDGTDRPAQLPDAAVLAEHDARFA